mmetsp:Transcript_10250/g.11817  ORF Transcript_10250/g.11817 Transcript_10250/m.11817 type:complete len:420 (+) Transcript_10250:149-1408(+)
MEEESDIPVVQDAEVQEPPAADPEPEEETLDKVDDLDTNDVPTEAVEDGTAAESAPPPSFPDNLPSAEELGLGESPPPEEEIEEMPLLPQKIEVTVFGEEAKVTEMTAIQVAAMIEFCFYGKDGMLHASQWEPSAGDVICAAPACVGQGMLLRWIDVLRNKGQPLSIADEIPWIESNDVENHRSWLDADQPGNFRIFKTHQTCQMLRSSITSKKDTKFISILREPVDFELAWYLHVEKIYETDREKFPDRPEFGSLFSTDDFVTTPVPMCHLSEFGKTSYELNLLEWFNLRNEKNVLLVFYEDLIEDGEKQLKRIADFIGADYDEELIKHIVSEEQHVEAVEKYHAYHVFHPEDRSVGKGKETLHEDSLAFLEDRWKDANIGIKLNIKDYDDMYKQAHHGNMGSFKSMKAPKKSTCTIS